MLVSSNLSLEVVVGEQLDLAWWGLLALRLDASLFGDESRQTLQISSRAIVCRLVALSIEPFQSWEALYTKLAAKLFVLICVHLANNNLVRGEFKILGKFFVNGGEVLAI